MPKTKRSDTPAEDKNAAIKETEEAFRKRDTGLIIKAWQKILRIFGREDAEDLVEIITEEKGGSKEK